MIRLIFCIAAILAVTGCARVNKAETTDVQTCEMIGAAKLRALLSKSETPSTMRQHMAEIFGAPETEVELVVNTDGNAYVRVKRSGVSYWVDMQGNRPVEGRLTIDAADQLSVAATLRCLGNPVLYRAYYAYGPGGTTHTLSLELFDPSAGWWISATSYGRNKTPPPLTNSMTVSFISLVIPSADPAVTLERQLGGSTYAQQLISQLKPWPGSWQDVRIDIDPALR